jgi:hypothetical protein
MIGPYVPFYPTNSPGALCKPEDYLLELILIDTIALADPARDRAAEQMIERCIPADSYDAVMDLYDELSAGDETAAAANEQALLQPWYDAACAKDSLWKIQMIAKLLYVAAGGQVVSTEALADVAALAERIDATPELRALLLVEADQDPTPALRGQARSAGGPAYRVQTSLRSLPGNVQ